MAAALGLSSPFEHGWWLVAYLALVPAGVLMELTGMVRAGSAVLPVALALHAIGMQRGARSVPVRPRIWEGAYYVLVALLAGSVVIGAALADALPWQ